MKLLILLMTAACLQVSASGYGQSLTLSLNDVSLEKAFKEIKRQTGYSFVYTRDQLKNAPVVTINLKNATLKEALDACFSNQSLLFVIEDRYVIIQNKSANASPLTEQFSLIEITGRVINEKDEPIVGASVKVKGTDLGTSTDANGEFKLKNISPSDILIISGAEVETIETMVGNRNYIEIRLNIKVNELDRVLIMAYGTTTKRLNTGSISKVTAAEISKQPVSNPLMALQGRVAGLVITQVSGIPGAAVKVQLRGRTSINTNLSNDPLFIIDGVPFAPNNDRVSISPSAFSSTGLSPMNSINPADIESIEVLKDADATSIYGSRGANGVILITTKKAEKGAFHLNANVSAGFSKVTRTMDMLDTKEYLNMRNEAFRNDGTVPNATPGSPGFAPDLTIWDTTRYTDFKNMLIGGTAHSLNTELSFSGGNSNTQFLVGLSYNKQSTVYPGDLSDTRATFHVNLNHTSHDKKFNLSYKGLYSYERNNINVSDLNTYIRLPPNLPSLYDSSGNLNWQQGGVTFDNPLAYSLREYEGDIDNLVNNLQLGYEFLPGLIAKTSIGYNSFSVHDYNSTPIASQNPATAPTGSATFGTNYYRSMIIEPQILFKKNIHKLRLDLLTGFTWQENSNSSSSILASGYNNDALLKSITAASSLSATSDYSQYKYTALFARLKLNWSDKYLLNMTARRDGSSRFGNANQFANFGSIGTAWIFSNENFILKNLSFISFGKIRASYGTTGNDKIGDYKYLDTYTSTGSTYQGVPAISPTSLYNSEYAWEMNKKFESAIELGFFKDRLLVTGAWYLNRCDNQLVNYTLPSQTGFTSIFVNFPATVENTGVEIELSSVNIQSEKFRWTSSFNISFPKNKLVSFPGIETSSYNYLVIGEPLSIYNGYFLAGVDPQTGIFNFLDKDGNLITTPVSADRVKNLGNLEPQFLGGFENRLQIKNFELLAFLEFRKQPGINYIGNTYLSTTYPGMMYNQPVAFLDRWQKPGDNTTTQKFTSRLGTPASNAANVLRISGTNLQKGDASYIRLKTVSIAYDLPKKWISKIKLEKCNLYLKCQNVLTFTNYQGADPETQELFRLPPLRTLWAGMLITL